MTGTVERALSWKVEDWLCYLGTPRPQCIASLGPVFPVCIARCRPSDFQGLGPASTEVWAEADISVLSDSLFLLG